MATKTASSGTKAHSKNANPKQQNSSGGAKDSCLKSLPPPKPREFISLYDTDGKRDVIVPNRNPHDLPGIWSKSEYSRLKNKAHIVTLQDRMAMIEEAERKKNELQRQSDARKELLQKAQLNQQAKLGTKLSDVEREAKKKNLYLLQRSHELLQEQDNRVKAANGFILATKCKAIRNAQIAEKELIEKQLQDEDHRLDMLMEQQRQKAILEEKKKKEEEDRKKDSFTKGLLLQMKMNETERLVEAERIEEESKMINKAFLALQKEEEERLRQKKEEQQQIREDLQKANEELDKYRAMQQEEERIADLRIRKFMEDKQAREQAREEEHALLKVTKEKEIARMRAQQEKSQDRQAALDEMNALRISEEVEREWRRKEMEAAKKRKEQEDMLKREREKQIDDLRKITAIRLARDEEEFHKVARIQREQYEKDLEKKKRIKEEAEMHRKELLKQINEKERERITQQKEKFEEGKMFTHEQHIKDQHVKEHLKKKIEKLKESKVPESYVKEVENHIMNLKDVK